jgi:hypothetical protein
MDTVFIELNKGYPVAVGRGHSLVIVGYVTDSKMPGNGFFIIRNSYGPDADDYGYRYETVDHLKTTVYDTYVYEMPAGVEFRKVLCGRVVDKNGSGVATARVEITGSTAAYGTFTRYDSTDANGRYRIPAIISLASSAIVRAISGAVTLTRSVALAADTTVLDFAPSTPVSGHSADLTESAALIGVRMDRSGAVIMTVSCGIQSPGLLEVYGLSGRLLLTKDIMQSARSVAVPYDGSRHAVLLWSMTFKNGIKKTGVIRLP